MRNLLSAFNTVSGALPSFTCFFLNCLRDFKLYNPHQVVYSLILFQAAANHLLNYANTLTRIHKDLLTLVNLVLYFKESDLCDEISEKFHSIHST